MLTPHSITIDIDESDIEDLTEYLLEGVNEYQEDFATFLSQPTIRGFRSMCVAWNMGEKRYDATCTAMHDKRIIFYSANGTCAAAAIARLAYGYANYHFHVEKLAEIHDTENVDAQFTFVDRLGDVDRPF
jgi:hypothetical protein